MLVRSAGKAGQGPSSIFGIASPTSSLHAQPLLRRDDQVVAVDVRRQAEPLEHRANHLEVVGDRLLDAQLPAGDGGERHEARRPRCGPGAIDVACAAEPVAAVHGEDVRADARRSRAPIDTSRRARSCTCGSEAALRIVVTPGASAAAIRAFSVAITLASSMKMSQARRPSGADIRYVAVDLDPARRARLSASRCGIEPAAADHSRRPAAACAPRRSGRAADRRAGTTPGSGSPSSSSTSVPRTASARSDDLVLVAPDAPSRRGPRAARASRRRRGCAARCRSRPPRP